MNDSIQKDVMLSALYLAIREREKQEKMLGYDRPSVILFELRRLEENINKGVNWINLL